MLNSFTYGSIIIYHHVINNCRYFLVYHGVDAHIRQYQCSRNVELFVTSKTKQIHIYW